MVKYENETITPPKKTKTKDILTQVIKEIDSEIEDRDKDCKIKINNKTILEGGDIINKIIENNRIFTAVAICEKQR